MIRRLSVALLAASCAVAVGQDFVAAVKAVQPALVSIYAEKLRRAVPADSTGTGIVPTEGVGSGAVIDTFGHVLTCDHLVSGYSELSVRLPDGTTYSTPDVVLVGRDPITDIAVVRVKAGRRFAVAGIGDSDELEVGQPVLALGSPFGLENSVSSGIVSALGRWGFHKATSGSDFQAFVQTDATINPGNSGGPLVDVSGRIVGVNSFIRTQRSGFTGIGFAVPSNLAADVARQLIAYGRVIRGYLGISTQAITEDLSVALELASRSGALVAQVSPGGPGARAGLVAGDVIVELDGEQVDNVRVFQSDVAALAPGSDVHLGVLHHGERRNLTATLTEWPGVRQDRPAVPLLKHWLGIRVASIPQADREKYSLEYGILAREVERLSPAADAGIVATDIILEMASTPLRGLADYESVKAKVVGSSAPILVRVLRGRQTFYTAITR